MSNASNAGSLDARPGLGTGVASAAAEPSFRFLVFALFFASGMAGLIYEVVWSRMLTYRFGATLDAVTAILVAFMGGLALGAWMLGKVADRSPRPLALYGKLEILIGLSALALPFLLDLVVPIYRALVNAAPDSFLARRLLRFGASIALLLIPTTAMGATLPALSKFLARSQERLGLNVGGLYALNTLGAVTGSFIAGYYLIANLGVQASLLIAASLNLVAGFAALFLSKRSGEGSDRAAAAADAPAGSTLAPHANLIAWVYAVSGFAALAFQVVWFRALVFNFQILKNTTYAFSAMLAVFLIGVALGSIVMTPLADRVKRPYLAFALLEAILGLCAFFSFVAIREGWPKINLSALSAGDGSLHWGAAVGYLFLKTSVAVFPPTFCMGLLFPIATRCYVGGVGHVGADVGRLYAFNTVGAIFGAFLATFLLVPLLGVGWSMLALAAVSISLGAIVAAKAGEGAMPRRAFLAVAPALAFFFGLASLNPADLTYPIVLHRHFVETPLQYSGDPSNVGPDGEGAKLGAFIEPQRDSKLVYYADGPLGTITVLENSIGYRRIRVDDVGVAGTDPVMLTDQKSLAHVPMLFVPEPKRILTVGFGSGGASYSYSTYPKELLKEIHCVEIDPTVPRAAATLTDSNWGFVSPKYELAGGGEKVFLPARAQERMDAERRDHKTLVPEIWDWLPSERDLRPSEKEAANLPSALEPFLHDRRPPDDAKKLGYFAADERYDLILDDARELLQSTADVYDVIATDCTDLRYKTNANLYDLEYFQACRDRISDDGLVVVWMPLGGLSEPMFACALRTFAEVFPKMGVWYMSNDATHYCLLLGWKNELKIDLDRMEERLAIPAVKRDLAELNLDSSEKILSCYLADSEALAPWWASAELNTENHPVLEFEAPKSGFGDNPVVDNLFAMAERRNDVMRYVVGSPDKVEAMRAELEAWEAAEMHILRGHRHFRLLEFGEACEEYVKARDLCPQDRSLQAILDFNEGRMLADKARGLRWCMLVGKFYAIQGRGDDALPYLRRFENLSLDHELAPKSLDALNEWRSESLTAAAEILRGKGDEEGAEKLLAKLAQPLANSAAK